MSTDTERTAENARPPDSARQLPSAGAAVPPPVSEELINILLVDDEPKNLTVLESVLNDPRYRLVRAESAEKALLALVVEEFALIVLDIQMPGMNGFELAQMIKQRKKTAGVPIIFLTAYYSEDQHVLEGYVTGAVDYLHKPINPAILRSKVAVFADLHRKTRALSLANRTLLAEITERRRAQEDLRQLARDLEQRVAERTADLVQANLAITQSEDRLKLAQSAGGVGVWDWNIVSDEIFWSETMWDIYGAMPIAAAQVHDYWRSALHPDDRQRVEDLVAATVASTDGQFRTEFRICHPDGTTHWVESVGRLHRDAGGVPVRMAGVTVDVTERKRIADQLRLSEERFQLALRNSQIVVYTTDRHLRYTWTSNAHQALVPERALGRNDAELFSPEQAAPLIALKQRVLESGVGEHTAFSVEVVGRRREFDLTVEPLSDASGERIGLTVAAMDITELKQAEAVLRETDRRKDEFLAILGHELRNPLAGITSAVEVLHAGDWNEADRQEIVPILERQTQHMRRLTDDLLEISRISRGKLHVQPKPVDLVEVVRGACTDFQHKLQAAGLTFDVQLPETAIWVSGDTTRLVQVMANLLDNALKHTDAGDTVTVVLRTDRDARRAVLTVRDSGIGIPPDLLGQVFEPFSQASSDQGGCRGGLGLGLALAKGLLTLLGGQISATSEGTGHGAEFTVQLPVIDPPAQATTHLEAAPDNRQRLGILIIDDSRDAAYPLKILLSRLGHDVHVETDGFSGVQAAKTTTPDLVLCDIGMPGSMDGYGVARELRADPATRNAYLVAVTGYGQDEDRRQAAAAGFDQHLTKPVSLDTLCDVIRKVPASRAKPACQTPNAFTNTTAVPHAS
jgi:PAS domain S-box-containing protein